MAKTPEEQKTANRDRARRRAEAGLCCSCNEKAIPGTRRCPKHTKEASEQAARRYQQRKAAQICPLCRDPEKEVVEGKACCQECLDKQAASTASRREDYKPRMSELRGQYYDERLAANLCVLCGKQPAAASRVDCDACNKANKARQQRRNERRRRAVIMHYGGKCACCGESTFEFLEIDHVNNDGAAHRKEIGKSNTYKWLINNKYPSGFRVLCSNCNHARGRYSYCPHELKRAKEEALDASPTFDVLANYRDQRAAEACAKVEPHPNRRRLNPAARPRHIR
jgi:hypothetical protein